MNVNKPGNIPLEKNQALAKAEAFCAYQERSQDEVRQKLYSWNLRSDQVEEMICNLIETNFLNEERFASAYALGKFRMKGWGKIRIKQGLKLKKVSPRLIEKSLKQIDADEYFERLCSILAKKAALTEGSDAYSKRQKLFQYLLSKGYESDLIFDALKSSGLMNN